MVSPVRVTPIELAREVAASRLCLDSRTRCIVNIIIATNDKAKIMAKFLAFPLRVAHLQGLGATSESPGSAAGCPRRRLPKVGVFARPSGARTGKPGVSVGVLITVLWVLGLVQP
jgi:hypothetical protein